jgi:inner membrane transporter RhtA
MTAGEAAKGEVIGRLGVLAPLAAAMTAMASFQVGAAIAKQLFAELGPLAVATLRIVLGAILLLCLARPWRTAWPKRAPIWPLLGLGLAMPGVILMFYLAMARLPLGVAIALQFLGPLSVAIAGSRRARDLLWAALAAGGVWLLVGVQGGAGRIDLVGIGWALGAAVGWASYILCGRAAGQAFGRSTAALAVSLAAVAILPFGAVPAAAILAKPALLPKIAAVAVFSTAVPFSLELFAMPRLPARTFAIFTSLEPAFAVLFGFILLHERLSAAQLSGVAAVIGAAAGAAWTARRPPPSDFAEAPPT